MNNTPKTYGELDHKGLMELAKEKAKKESQCLYSGIDSKERRVAEKRLTDKYYLQMVTP